MKLHLLVESLDGERASLRSDSAQIFHVPVNWLPATVIEGTSLLIETVGGDDRSEIVIRVGEGVTGPHGTDVGG